MARLVLLSFLLPLAAYASVPAFILVIEHGYPDEVCGPTINDPGLRHRRLHNMTHALGTYITVQDCAIAARAAGVDAFSYEPDGRFPGTCWQEKVTVSADLFASWNSSTGAPVCPGGGWVNATHTNTYAFAPSMPEQRTSASAEHAPAGAPEQPKRSSNLSKNLFKRHRMSTFQVEAVDPSQEVSTTDPADEFHANDSDPSNEEYDEMVARVHANDPADEFHADDPADDGDPSNEEYDPANDLHADSEFKGIASWAQSSEELRKTGPAKHPAEELRASDPADELHADP